MKAAIISDIHGNFQALEAVLADIKQSNCDKMFCLGDLALAGPEPVRVVEFIQKQDWTIIQGNTDELIAHYSPALFKVVQEKFPLMANALTADVQLLNNEQKEFLKKLPTQLELEIEGVKVLLVHGSPRKNNENIFPDMPLAEIEEMLVGVSADVVFCGHTHVPCGYQASKTVVNVGSIGRPMTSDAMPCYVIANFNDGSFELEHKFVDYDRQTAAKILSERDFDGAKEIAELLINPAKRHV